MSHVLWEKRLEVNRLTRTSYVVVGTWAYQGDDGQPHEEEVFRFELPESWSSFLLTSLADTLARMEPPRKGHFPGPR